MRNNGLIKDPGFKYTPEIFVRTGIASWFFVGFINLVFYGADYRELSFVQGSVGATVVTILLFLFCMAGLTFIEMYYSGLLLTEYIMVISYILMSLLMLTRTTREDVFFIALAIIGIGILIVVYALNRGCFTIPNVDISKKTKYIIIGSFGAVFTFLICAIGVLRYETYFSPNFDFGIVSQMFYSMKEHFVPNTTCERDYILSHFGVHFSPACYLLLPIYFIFPYPNTLQIAQGVLIMSAVIPIILICKERGLTNKATAFVGLLYMAYPAVTAGCTYDFHENCLLLPLLMWTILFMEKEKYLLMAIMALLTLMVKEDVFIYLIILAVFIIVSKGRARVGTALFAGSLVYFAVAYTILSEYGLGIMDDSRYGNLIFEDSGLLGVVRTVFVNPSYAFTQLLTTEGLGEGKIKYLFELFAPLAFIPFVTRKMSRYILLAPVLLNMMSMYPYQYDIGFQYSFGITGMIFYVLILNLGDMKQVTKRYLGVIACFISIILYLALAFGRQISYWQEYGANKDVYNKMDEVLEEYVPDDVSVVCSTYLLPHLSQRDEVYESFYHQVDGKYKTDVDYVVLFLRKGCEQESEKEGMYYLSHGYEEVYEDDMLWILKKSK